MLLFVAGMIVVVAEVLKQLHLDLLLVFIAAGFVVRNFSRYEHDLLEAVVGDETEFARLKSLMISQRFDEYMIGGLIKLIRDHFQAQVGKGSDAVPGKSPA